MFYFFKSTATPACVLVDVAQRVVFLVVVVLVYFMVLLFTHMFFFFFFFLFFSLCFLYKYKK
mgnify:CR=1 FL=1